MRCTLVEVRMISSNDTRVRLKLTPQFSIIFGHEFIPEYPADNCILGRPHRRSMCPRFQPDFRLDDIGKTSRPLIPWILVCDIFNGPGMNQFRMSAHVIFLSTQKCNMAHTKNCGELNDLSDRCDHPIFDEILMSNDCLRDAFCEVLRSSILDDEVVGKEAAIIFETELCSPQILWRGPNVVEQASKIIDL